MGLPPYTGPFKVGVLDLEIPVRNPRSFCNNVVEPGELNKPARKARNQAKKQNKQAKDGRDDKQQEKQHRSHGSTPATRSSPEASTQATSVNNDGDEAGEEDDDNHDNQEETTPKMAWSPWSSGSKTSTLHLETVLFSIYYPTLPMSDTEEKRYPRAAWLGRPVHAGVRALLQYIGQYGAFAIPASPAVVKLVKARMPARVGPPLADPAELRRQAHPDRDDTDRAKAGNFGKKPPQFPVVIFSHGLAGNRLSYSQYCGELASQGIIVAAIEHRDGSGVSSIVRGEEAPDKAEQSSLHMPKIIGHKSSGRMKASVPYFTFEQIGLRSFAGDPNDREMNLRRDQIEMRHAEIEETLYVLNEINEGRGFEIAQRSTRNLGTKLAGHSASAASDRLPPDSLLKAEHPLADWKAKLDLDLPTLCGHSFGGATVIEMMRKENPYLIAIVLDPWVEPVRDPAKDEDEVKGRITKPVYVLNSESFTVWEDHFEKLKRICLDARKSCSRGWLLTLTGSKHTDFSDYPFLLPRVFRSTVGPKHTIEAFSKATFKQMGLSRQRIREQENSPGYKVDRKGTLSDSGPDNGDAVAPEATHAADSVNGQGQHSTKGVNESQGARNLCLSPVADHQDGLGRRGKINASETMVQSQTVIKAEDGKQHEVDGANANAREDAATTAFERPGSTNSKRDVVEESEPQASTSSQDQDSCQALREECRGDGAAYGQEARDLLSERQRMTSRGSNNSFAVHVRANQGGQTKDFITDIKYLKMIDADQDVQQVHQELEDIKERFANKSKFYFSRHSEAWLATVHASMFHSNQAFRIWRTSRCES